MAKVKIKEYKDSAGEWRINQTSSNGKIVDAVTEGYHNKLDAKSNRIKASIAYLEHYADILTPGELLQISEISDQV